MESDYKRIVRKDFVVGWGNFGWISCEGRVYWGWGCGRN